MPELPTYRRIPMTAPARRPLCALACALVLVSCAIPPKPEQPQLRNEAPLAGVPASGSHRAWPDPEWWQRYEDAQLTALEERALAGSPSLAEAGRRFGTALQAIEVAGAAAGLSSRANAQVQRQRLSEHGLIPPRFLGFTWYNQGDLSLQFEYDFDFWGRTRAAVAAALDESRAAQAERSAVTLMLTTAIADTYFGWQADQARLALAIETISALDRVRTLAARRAARGIDPPDPMHQADAGLAAARELAAACEGAARIRHAALAALLGLSPADLPALEPRTLPEPDSRLPEDAGLDLLARRPDIAASRWRVEAAMRRVEQARAGFYPDIRLGALVGLQSIDLDTLLEAGSRMGAIGPALHLPLFARGELEAAYGMSQAQLLAAAASYDALVVDAARDVALRALELEQVDARREERTRQLQAMRSLEGAALARARQGLGDDRDVLAARARVLEQRDALVQLQAQAISSGIALTKALGGGYRMDPTAASTRPAAATSNPTHQQAPSR
jgi:multidrug efflux system outer membrane protein